MPMSSTNSESDKTSSSKNKASIVIGAIILLPIFAALVAANSVGTARWGGIVVAALAIYAIFKPQPFPLLNKRLASFGLLYFALFAVLIGFSITTDAELEALKLNDPDKYLATVKSSKDDKVWLQELAELKPDAHKAELERRESERQERIKKEEAERQERIKKAETERIEREEKRKLERAERVTSYVNQIEREFEGPKSFDAHKYTENQDIIVIGLAVLSAWAVIYEDGEKLELTPEQEAKRQRFKSEIIKAQRKALPILRDAYGPAMRKVLWEHDVTARTFGNRFTVAEFVAGMFAANRNIKEFNDGVWENLKILRFKQSRYKWYKEESKYTYFKIDSPSDEELVVWTKNGRYRKVE